MMLRRWLLGSVAIAVVASGLLARPGVVTHRDGNTYTGGAHANPLLARFVWLPRDNRQLTIQPVDLWHPKMPNLGAVDWPRDWPSQDARPIWQKA